MLEPGRGCLLTWVHEPTTGRPQAQGELAQAGVCKTDRTANDPHFEEHSIWMMDVQRASKFTSSPASDGA